MTYKSFESYQGQYHLSYVTEEKAGKIYENWIESSLNECNDKNVIIAEYEGSPIGFVTIAEKEHAVEGVLSAVEDVYKRQGLYRPFIIYSFLYMLCRNLFIDMGILQGDKYTGGMWLITFTNVLTFNSIAAVSYTHLAGIRRSL